MARRKKTKFGDGGMLDLGDPIDTSSIDTMMPDATGGAPLTDAMPFGAAFRAARSSGAKTFMWRGKLYGTQLAGETSSPSSRSRASATPSRSTPASSPASTPSRVASDAARGAAMRQALTPTAERVTPDMLAAIQRIAGAPRNNNGDVISVAQAAKQAAARKRAAGYWAQAKGQSYAKGGSVKSRDGIAKKGKTKAKGKK